MMTGIGEAIETGPSKPNRSPSQPLLEDGDQHAVGPPTDNRFIRAAFSGTTVERNTSISSRNEAAGMAAMKTRQGVVELTREVIHHRREARHVHAVGHEPADPFDRLGGGRVRGLGGRDGRQHRRRRPSGRSPGSPTTAMPESAAAARSAGQGLGVQPRRPQVGDDQQRAVDARTEAVGQQVVGAAVGGGRRLVAGVRKASCMPSAGAASASSTAVAASR